MSPPEKARGPAANRAPKTATISTKNPSTDGGSVYGAMMDRPLTTTRRCEGQFCWCRAGSEIAWPLSHDDELEWMAREIRSLEIAGGVLGI